MELIRDIVKVEWVELGEGISGDYNPNNPDDVELLRFDVSVLRDGVWQMKDDGSYCTRFPVSESDYAKKAGLQILLDRFYDVLRDDPEASIKKLGEEMSWICPEDVLKPYRILVTETYKREVEVYAANAGDAQQFAEALCDDSVIDLNVEDFDYRSIVCLGRSRPNDLALHDAYNLCTDKELPQPTLNARISDAAAKAAENARPGAPARETGLNR